MKMSWKDKGLQMILTVWALVSVWSTQALAVTGAPPTVNPGSSGSTISNPLAGSGGSIGSGMANLVNSVMGMVYAVGGVWFLFHLYKAIMSLMAKSSIAQKRDEAKSHLIHVAVSGVLLGGATLIAGMLFNFGTGL